MSRRKKIIHEFKGIRIHCTTLKKTVNIKPDAISWHVSSDNCDLCGSHGGASISFKCPCGKEEFYFDMYSW